MFLKQPWEHREGHRAQPDFQIKPSGGPARGDQVKGQGGIPGKGEASRMVKGKEKHDSVVLTSLHIEIISRGFFFFFFF